MFYSVFILMVSIIPLIVSNSNQFQPFGTTGTVKNIEAINGEYPNPLEFFSNYLPKAEPILSRQVLVKDLYYNIWKTEKQLENEVDGLGKTNVYVEAITQQQRLQMKFGDFLDRYKKDQLFLADTLPEILRKYLVVPRPLQCDAVLHTLQSVSLIMNDINTSPLIFNEEYDPLLCLFRGNKHVVLVNTKKYPDIRQYVVSSNREAREALVNPDRVDLKQFPALANIDYHTANLTAGDCLLVPSGWILQERSLDSSTSIIYNIDHAQAVDVDLNAVESCSATNSYDAAFTLDQIDWSAVDEEPRNLKDVMINLINSKSKSFEKWQETFSKHLSFDLNSDPETSAIFDEFYGIIDVDGNGEITAMEIEQIDGMHQHHISDILYEIWRVVNDKKTINSSNDVKREEEFDENLPSENDKTDL